MNYRGISLLSCISKLYSTFINGRISKFLEHNDLLSDEQNGFRANRSCEDHVFTLNSIIKYNTSVYVTFIDLKKKRLTSSTGTCCFINYSSIMLMEKYIIQ